MSNARSLEVYVVPQVVGDLDLSPLVFHKGDQQAYLNHYAAPCWRQNPFVMMAAIQGSDGLIHTSTRPGRHPHVLFAMSTFDVTETLEPIVNGIDVGQGFVLSDGRYVCRREGMRIAREVGQRFILSPFSDELYSENIW